MLRDTTWCHIYEYIKILPTMVPFIMYRKLGYKASIDKHRIMASVDCPAVKKKPL